jgi:hypothetical protein
MAVLTGISGNEIYDSEGGKIALSVIEQDIMRNLSSSTDSFIVFNARNGLVKDSIEAGSAYFRTLQLIGNETYTPDYETSDTPASGQIRVDLDQLAVGGYELSTYNFEHIRLASELRNRLSENSSKSIRKTLNARFLMKAYEDYTNGTISNVLAVPELVDPTATAEQIKAAAFKIYDKAIDLVSSYDKYDMGCEFSEFFGAIALKGIANLLRSYTNPMNTNTAVNIEVLGRKVVSQNLWGLPYLTDDMLLQTITKNQFFNKDFECDLSNFVGFVAHLEAFSFPFRIVETATCRAKNFNIQVATKFMWGFKTLRPSKVCVLVKEEANKA